MNMSNAVIHSLVYKLVPGPFSPVRSDAVDAGWCISLSACSCVSLFSSYIARYITCNVSPELSIHNCLRMSLCVRQFCSLVGHSDSCYGLFWCGKNRKRDGCCFSGGKKVKMK